MESSTRWPQRPWFLKSENLVDFVNTTPKQKSKHHPPQGRAAQVVLPAEIPTLPKQHRMLKLHKILRNKHEMGAEKSKIDSRSFAMIDLLCNPQPNIPEGFNLTGTPSTCEHLTTGPEAPRGLVRILGAVSPRQRSKDL